MKEFKTTRKDKVFIVGESGFSLLGKKGSVIWEASMSKTVVLYLTDNKHTLEIEVLKNGENDSLIVSFDSSMYEVVKMYLKSNLENVNIRKLSMLRQLSFISSMIAGCSFVFGVTYYFSRQVEITGELQTGAGRKGAVSSDAINYLTETFGSQVILISGCCIVALLVLMFIKTLIAPKKGITIDFMPNTSMKRMHSGQAEKCII